MVILLLFNNAVCIKWLVKILMISLPVLSLPVLTDGLLQCQIWKGCDQRNWHGDSFILYFLKSYLFIRNY